MKPASAGLIALLANRNAAVMWDTYTFTLANGDLLVGTSKDRDWIPSLSASATKTLTGVAATGATGNLVAGSGTQIFYDSFDGTGSITGHTPNLEPVGSVAYADITSGGANLSGTGNLVLPAEGNAVAFVSKDTLGNFPTVAGKTYLQYRISSNVSGNTASAVEFDFGPAESDYIRVTCRTLDGVSSVRCEVNGSNIVTANVAFANQIVRVEFQNGAQQVFVGGASQGTANLTIASVSGLAGDTPSLYMLDGDASDPSMPTPVNQATLWDFLEFGSM